MTKEEKALQDIRDAIRRGQEVLTIKEIADCVDMEIGPGLLEEALQEEES